MKYVNEFEKALTALSFFTSRDRQRASLCGVCVDPDANGRGWCLVATDGSKLLRLSYSADDWVNFADYVSTTYSYRLPEYPERGILVTDVGMRVAVHSQIWTPEAGAGETSIGAYPLYRSIIPDHFGCDWMEYPTFSVATQVAYQKAMRALGLGRAEAWEAEEWNSRLEAAGRTVGHAYFVLMPMRSVQERKH